MVAFCLNDISWLRKRQYEDMENAIIRLSGVPRDAARGRTCNELHWGRGK